MYSTFFRYSTFPVLEYFGTLVWLSSRNHWQVTHLLMSVATVCSSDRFKFDFLSLYLEYAGAVVFTGKILFHFLKSL